MVSRNGEYSGVPTSIDLDNSSSQKKYTVNQTPKGQIRISKLLCCLLGLSALILIALAAVATFYLMPKCSDPLAENLTERKSTQLGDASHAGTANEIEVGDVELPKIQAHIEKRLPRSIVPYHYTLKLVPNLSENFTTEGYVKILIEVKDETRKIVLNAKDLIIKEESIKVRKVENGELLKVASVGYEEQDQIFVVTTAEILWKGEKLDLEMDFNGTLNDNMLGFYRTKYGSTENKKQWMATTQFCPTDARRAFPCFDEPSFKAKFLISIARSKNMTTLSNMPLDRSEPFLSREEWLWDHYQETPLMSTYLVAFMVQGLQKYVNGGAKSNFSMWSRHEVIDQTMVAFDLAPRILKFFEDYFNVKYALSKLDFVAVPDMSYNAMENWGLITFREGDLLYQNRVSSLMVKRTLTMSIAHEIAHQWFGNLVTPFWWEDLWMSEGFATYFQYIGTQSMHSNWYVIDEFPMDVVQKAFYQDSLKSTRPLSVTMSNNDEIRQAFDSISYEKGASVIRMLSHILGQETFKNGLSTFLNTHKFGNANRENLFDVMSAQAQQDETLQIADGNVTLKDIMEEWTVEPGFPVITARRNGSTIHISQHRFLRSGKILSSLLWYVPISFTSGDDPNFEDTKPKVWLLRENETHFELKTKSWYLLNLRQTGYYIVNYDEANWKALINNGVQTLPSIIKGQLVCDSMDLAEAGLLDYDIPLRMILEFARDLREAVVPHTSILRKLVFLDDMLLNTEAYNHFQTLLEHLFNPAFDSIDLNQRPSDNYQLERLTPTVLPWACTKSGSRCAVIAQMSFRKWISGDQMPVGSTRDVVLCTALREGSETEWNFVYKQYLNESTPSEKGIFLNALGCSREPWMLSRYLNMIIREESGIRKQDGPIAFAAVAKNSNGYHIAFDFLRNKWHEIRKYYGEGYNGVSVMLESLAKYMNTPYQLAQIKDFKSKHINSLGTTSQAVDRTIERIAINVKWMNFSYKSIEGWLQSYIDQFHLRK